MIEIEAVDGVNLTEWKHNVDAVTNAVPMVALFDQLAEESAELAKAAIKVARVVRGENRTPVTRYEAMKNVMEELADLAVVLDVLELEPDRQVMKYKLKRWVERLQEGVKNV